MKLRLSKRGLSYLLFKIRNFSLVESTRRLNSNPVAEAEAVLQKAEAYQYAAPPKDLDLSLRDGFAFMPAYRRDGVGIQAFVRICVMFLSQHVGATYLHLPFLEVQHQFNDPLGRFVSQLDWAKKWETFLNLGQDESAVSDLVQQVGQKPLARKLADENRQFGKPGIPPRSDLSDFLVGPSGYDAYAKDLNVFDLRFFRDTATAELAFDSAFVERLQAKFESNGYVPCEQLYSDRYVDIAIHIRRGDVWESYRAGDQRWEENIRFVSEDYYVNLLQRLQALPVLSAKPMRFHIFSDGSAADFSQFTFVSKREAYLELPSGARIENIQFHLSQNSLDALYHLATAPVLVPAKSSFSFLAVLLGKSRVFYDDAIYGFYQYGFLKDYMQRNARFVRLNDVKQQVGCSV